MVVAYIDRFGETSARRLFTSVVVDRVIRLARLGHVYLGYTPWAPA
ncbi:hypothetical protein ACWD5F_07285 [Streptomyces sp. NPDC002499]